MVQPTSNPTWLLVLCHSSLISRCPHSRSLPWVQSPKGTCFPWLFPGPRVSPPLLGAPTGSSGLSPSPTPRTLCSYFILVTRHTHSHACIYLVTHLHTHALTHVYTCMHTCSHVQMCSHKCTQIPAHMCSYRELTYSCVHTHDHAHMHSYIHRHTLYTRTYMHAPWCTQTHACMHTHAHVHTLMVGLSCTVIPNLFMSLRTRLWAGEQSLSSVRHPGGSPALGC